ncbi:VOC family protein [Amycolatopsis suaedae]|uniref:VOC family protein n=1 Tax=Amycolatopsis suaedae TaxID=2510978 RepID=A0A4Q7J1S6_9PSEU|nr:VOC family protein [Amycolatopsis suaedae]RZQ60819.1 VOC family protein [Amycolatopsis suaedae]
MSQHPTAVPAGYNTVSPWIINADTAGVLDFMTTVFGAEELGRMVGEDGTIGHAEARIGESVVLLFDSRPDWPATPAFLRIYVEDGDAVLDRATAAGATVVTELTELFWGDRVGRVRDPFGNLWWIQQRVADLTPEQIEQRMTEPRFVEAMAYVTSSELVLN